jgi:D-alanyl-D-alanine carboxypeptidase
LPVATTTPTPTLTPAPEYFGQVICTANEFVNIRSGAGTQTDIIGTLPAGESADVIAYEDDWVHISYNNITGYVSRSYTVSKHTPGIAVPDGDWAMILVSPRSHLPQDFSVTLADFEGGQVDARIRDICTEMFADAAHDGITFQLVDAYRSRDLQSALFEDMVSRYTSQGYSRGDAEAKAATITARPDTSEHQTGLALDIVTPSYTKRNKADKTDITGVIYEPWHWRFVGTEAALAMQQSGQCFEEYLGGTD